MIPILYLIAAALLGTIVGVQHGPVAAVATVEAVAMPLVGYGLLWLRERF